MNNERGTLMEVESKLKEHDVSQSKKKTPKTPRILRNRQIGTDAEEILT